MPSLEHPEYTAKITTADGKLEFNLGKSNIITDLIGFPGFSGCAGRPDDRQHHVSGTIYVTVDHAAVKIIYHGRCGRRKVQDLYWCDLGRRRRSRAGGCRYIHSL